MRTPFLSILFSNRSMAWGWGIGAVGVLVQWALIGIFIWQLPPEIPLWYSLPTGGQQLAYHDWFVVLPILGTVMLGINLGLVRLGLNTMKVYMQMITWLSTLAQFLITLAMIHTLLMAF